jgi:hypothetical protein
MITRQQLQIRNRRTLKYPMVGPDVKTTERRKQGGMKSNNSCALAEMELGGRTVVEALVQSLMIVEAKVIG